MTKQALSIHLVLLSLVLFSAWLCMKLPMNEPLLKRIDNRMDTFMSNIVYVQTNTQGNIQALVHAARIEHFAGQDMTLFHRPDVTIYNRDQNQKSQPWHITADLGIAESGLKKMRLKDNVIARHYQPNHHYTMKFFTQILDIFPLEKVIETKSKITLLQPGTVIKSTGFKVDMHRGTIELLSKAFAHFDTNIK